MGEVFWTLASGSPEETINTPREYHIHFFLFVYKKEKLDNFTNPILIFPLVFIGDYESGLFQISLALLMNLQIDEKFIGSRVGIYRTFQDAGSVIDTILVMLIAEATDIRSTFMVGLAAYI